MKTLGLLLGTLGFIMPLNDSNQKFEPKYYNNVERMELFAIKEEEIKLPKIYERKVKRQRDSDGKNNYYSPQIKRKYYTRSNF